MGEPFGIVLCIATIPFDTKHLHDQYCISLVDMKKEENPLTRDTVLRKPKRANLASLHALVFLH